MTHRTNKYLDMGEIGEQEVDIEYDHQPEERMTRDYPGCSEYIEITSVKWMGIELLGYISEKSLDSACEEILEEIHDDAEFGQ